MQMYLSEKLFEEHLFWQKNSQIFIDAETGAGKTTYILSVLLPYVLQIGGEILYISNRVGVQRSMINGICKMQGVPFELMKNETVAEFAGITVMTYQALQERITNASERLRFPYFHYVVLDELHYLVADAEFNPKIQRIIPWIQNPKCYAKIVISATMDPVLKVLGFWSTEWQTIHQKENLTISARKSSNVVDCLRGENEFRFFYSFPRTPRKMNIFVYEETE